MKCLRFIDKNTLFVYFTQTLILLCSFMSLSVSAATLPRYFKVTDTNFRSAFFVVDPEITIVDADWLLKGHNLRLTEAKEDDLSEQALVFRIHGGVVASKKVDDEVKSAVQGEAVIGLIQAALALSGLTPEERQRGVPKSVNYFRFLIEIPFQRGGDLASLLDEVNDMITVLYSDNAIAGHSIKKVFDDRGRKYGLRIELSTPYRFEIKHSNTVSMRTQYMMLLSEQLFSVCRYPFLFIEPGQRIKHPFLLQSVPFKLNSTSTASSSGLRRTPGLLYYKSVDNDSNALYLAMDGVLDAKKYTKLSGVDVSESCLSSRWMMHLPQQVDRDDRLITLFDLLTKCDLVSLSVPSNPSRTVGTTEMHQLVFERRDDETPAEAIQRIAIVQKLVKKHGGLSMTFASGTHQRINGKDQFRLVFIANNEIKSGYYNRIFKRALEPYTDAIHTWYPPSLEMVAQPSKEKVPEKDKKKAKSNQSNKVAQPSKEKAPEKGKKKATSNQPNKVAQPSKEKAPEKGKKKATSNQLNKLSGAAEVK